MFYSSTCYQRPPPVRSESGPSWQGTEIHDIQSKTYIIIIATKVKHSNTTFNYDILMLTYTLNDNIVWLQLHPEHIKINKKVKY